MRARLRPARMVMAACLLLCAAYVQGAGQSAGRGATIAGVVRDGDGKVLTGARLKLSSEPAGTLSAEGTSADDGAYRFEQIAAGTYRIEVNLSGFSEALTTVTVAASDASVVAEITLKRGISDIGSVPKPALKFEAAGVRGLIDPGGYSAPANAAAASGLISGIADIKRVNNGSTSANGLPCALEPDLKKAVEASPQKADANRRLGEFYLQHRQPEQAVLYLKRARQLDDSDPATAKELGDALMMIGKFDAARELLTSLPANQMDAGMQQRVARAEEGLGQFVEASKDYQAAAARDPSEQNLFGVGYELILAGSPIDAAKAFDAGVARYPQSVTLLIGAGTAEFLRGQSGEAVKLFLHAAASDPSDPRPYAFLAGAYGISGAEGPQVRATLKRHLDLAPEDAKAHYFYALGISRPDADGAAVDEGRVEMLLKQAVALDPAFADAHFRLGVLYAQRDDYENAAREFEATLRLVPGLRDAHYRLAAAYRKTGRTQQAAHEMQLFREARETQAKTDGGISIAQFISVVDPPGSANDKQARCAAVPQ